MAKTVRHIADLRALVRRALDRGAQVTGIGRVTWDASGGCTDPVALSLEGRAVRFGDDPFRNSPRVARTFYGDGYDGRGSYSAAPLWLDIDVPCRRCQACLKRRAAHWAKRAESELLAAPRTWFATFTLAPEEHFRVQLLADRANLVRGHVWECMTPDEQFAARTAVVGKELTKYFKRIRKESGVPLRYILVAEAHKSGLPHFHALIHEIDGSRPVRYRTLHQQWKLGFSKFELVKSRGAARYVCKYLSKAALARVRASVGYGKTS